MDERAKAWVLANYRLAVALRAVWQGYATEEQRRFVNRWVETRWTLPRRKG